MPHQVHPRFQVAWILWCSTMPEVFWALSCLIVEVLSPRNECQGCSSQTLILMDTVISYVGNHRGDKWQTQGISGWLQFKEFFIVVLVNERPRCPFFSDMCQMPSWRVMKDRPLPTSYIFHKYFNHSFLISSKPNVPKVGYFVLYSEIVLWYGLP